MSEHIESHSEKEILKNCISLMDELVRMFQEWYLWQHGEDALEEMPKEEWFGLNMTYFHIVQKLFLYGTTHSGGTSTGEKCAELGVGTFDNVVFEFDGGEDEED